MLLRFLSKILPLQHRIDENIVKLENDKSNLMKIIEQEITESINNKIESQSEAKYIVEHYSKEIEDLKQKLFSKYSSQIELQLLKLRNIKKAVLVD